MTLAAGHRLSHYEILGPIGAGAMGEVYRARDTRLQREVALKVLPADLAGDPDRLQRFEREARALASLNHPNVAQVFGIDEVDDTCFIAMELVPGEDLAARLARGPLPSDDAIDVCRQIAEGLEAAHEAGVIHRDLKPANVRITPEGVVKILDFGLAKPIRPGADGAGTTTAESDSFLLTEEGVVLGTPTYMSPEQARGQPVDRRTDVWSLGCILYECLTGRRPFAGDSMTDVLAAIVKTDPDWSRLPKLPPRVTELLHRMLDKDPRRRLRDAGEARVQLALAADEPATAADADHRPGPRAAVAVLLAVGMGAGGLLVGMGLDSGAGGGTAERTLAATPLDRPICAVVHEFEQGAAPRSVVISRDATQVAWIDGTGLHVRPLADPVVRTIVPRGSISAFDWSPDSREIAYLDEGAIWRTAIEAPLPVRVAKFDGQFWSRLQWTDTGQIAYLRDDGVAAVTPDGKRWLLAPFEDPDVAHIDAFAVAAGGAGVAVIPHYDARERLTIELLRDGQRKEIVELPAEPGGGWVTNDGWILWQMGSTLWGAKASFADLTLIENPRVILEDWDVDWFSLAENGTLVYLLPDQGSAFEIVVVDRTGAVTPLEGRYPNLFGADFVPDGTGFLFSTTSGNRCDVWRHDLDRGTTSPWIHREDGAAAPLCLRDGRIGVTPLFPMTGTDIYPASGKGAPEELDVMLMAMTPDGTRRVVALDSKAYLGKAPIFLQEAREDAERSVLFDGEHDEIFCGLTRDAAWMLHTSTHSGRNEAYLTRFPPDEEVWPVSTDGAENAWFSKDGTEILYLYGKEVFRVALETEPRVRLGAPELLFTVPSGVQLRAYDGVGRFVGGKLEVRGKVYVDTAGLPLD